MRELWSAPLWPSRHRRPGAHDQSRLVTPLQIPFLLGAGHEPLEAGLAPCPRVPVSTVLDVNDETPTFSPAVYNVSVSEDVPREFRVVWLNCTDNDVGLNAELSYFITGGRPAAGAAGAGLGARGSVLAPASRRVCSVPQGGPPEPVKG